MDSIEQKNKLSIMNSMMSNPKIAQTLHKAFNAKIGSTDRKKGQELIAIFSKVDPRKDYTGMGGVFDGKGGPMIGPQPFIGPQPAPTPSPFIGPMPFIGPKNPNTKILPKSPSFLQKTVNSGLLGFGTFPNLSEATPKTDYEIPNFQPYKAPEGFQEAPGTKLLVNAAGIVGNEILNKTVNPAINATATLGGYLKSALGGLWGAAKMTGRAISDTASNLFVEKAIGAKPLGTLTYEKQGDKLAGLTKPTETPAKTKTITENVDVNGKKDKVTKETINPVDETKKPLDVINTDPNKQTGATTDPTAKVEKVNVTGADGGSTTVDTTGATTGGNVGSITGGNTGNTTGGTPVTTKGGAPAGGDLESLIAAIGDTPLAKALVGKDVEKQLSQVRELINNEHDVASIRQQQADQRQKAPTIKQDMTDYIRSQDKAISHIDGMLDQAYKDLSSGGLTPEMREDQKKYINMLIGMKSTHNQNYAEYVNKSIEQFNNESTRIDQLYQNAVNNANEDYKNKGSLIQADYERHMKDYEEAKKELDGAYEKSLRITILKRQAYDALTKDSQNAIDGIEAGKFQQARDNIWKNPQFKEGKDENEYDPNVPLVNMFEQLTTKEGNPGQQTFEVASQALTNRLKNMDGAQAASELSGKWMSQVKNMLTSGDYNQNEKDQIKMFARDLVQRVKPQVTSNIKQNGSVAYNLFSQLGETDSYWSGKKPAKTREAFITDNSKISPAILGYVYDGWKQFVKGQQYANVGGNVDPNEELKAAVNRGLENGMTKEETASNLVSTFYVNGLLSSVMAQ